MAKTSYMNNFTVSLQNLTCILEAKATAPNIERTQYGVPPVFDERKVVDENYVYMPIEVAKELALSLMQVINNQEKRSHFQVRLNGEKQAMWEAAIKGMDAYSAEKARQEKEKRDAEEE